MIFSVPLLVSGIVAFDVVRVGELEGDRCRGRASSPPCAVVTNCFDGLVVELHLERQLRLASRRRTDRGRRRFLRGGARCFCRRLPTAAASGRRSWPRHLDRLGRGGFFAAAASPAGSAAAACRRPAWPAHRPGRAPADRPPAIASIVLRRQVVARLALLRPASAGFSARRGLARRRFLGSPTAARSLRLGERRRRCARACRRTPRVSSRLHLVHVRLGRVDHEPQARLFVRRCARR